MEIFIQLIRYIPTYIMGAIFFYKFFSHSEKSRYNVTKTIFLTTIVFCIARILVAVFNIDGLTHTLIVGSIFLALNHYLYVGSNKFFLLLKGIFIWGALFCYERFLVYYVFSWSNANADFSFQKDDWVKILYISIFYMGFTIHDILIQKRKEKVIRYIAVLNLFIGISQIFLVKLCVTKNLITDQNQISFISIIFSLVLVIEYLLTVEIFRELLEQQKKASELEMIKIERKYQYNYYKFAQKQGEEIRDIRHDLRNQIQIVQYLVKSGENKAGREMLVNIKKKVNYLE